MPVLDADGRLVGRVVEPVSGREARVQLITDSACGVSVLAGSPPAVGILRGRGDGMCELKYILDSGPVLAPGAEIVTSGLDGLYPAGVKAGVVEDVKRDATLFQKVRVRPYFGLAGLGSLAVLKRPPRDFFNGDVR
jgi:rod shape-determining protein MreC